MQLLGEPKSKPSMIAVFELDLLSLPTQFFYLYRKSLERLFLEMFLAYQDGLLRVRTAVISNQIFRLFIAASGVFHLRSICDVK